MKKIICGISIFILLFSISCKKQAGEGGQATIKGKVMERKMSADFTTCYGQYVSADKTVYIIYGDDATYGNNTKTGPDGVFEFQYLRKGSYKIYTYSNDSLGTVGPPVNASAPKIAVSKSVEITSRKQLYESGTMVVYN
ncbi:MAG: hypothetical protein WCP52_09040 [Bacteroidota bacterium]